MAGWSPEQITARLRVDHPDEMEMRISPETIYQSLFVQAGGELRRQLKGDLRSGRTRRRQRSAGERRGRAAHMISISERPAEVEDRAVPGHREGDLLMGANNQSAIATLVERHTRYVLLARLQDGHGTERVIDAIIERIGNAPRASGEVSDLGPGAGARRAQALHRADRHPGVLRLIPTPPGSEGLTRTPTGCCASTSPNALIWPLAARSNSTASRPYSAYAPAKRWAG